MTLSDNGYRCSAGETFDSVALYVFGNEKYAAELLNANPELCLIPVFTGGEILRLPEIDMPEGEGNTQYMPDKAPWKEE